MTDHNDTGATARPSLTEMQLEILEECAGIRSPRLWGAAVGACLESLRAYGFIERNGKVTSAGATAIINAYDPLKARLAEVERERDEARNTIAKFKLYQGMSGPDQVGQIMVWRTQAEQFGNELDTAEARIAVLERALEFYANPEIYKPHPHGPAFDRRDESYIARTALAAEQKEAGK